MSALCDLVGCERPIVQAPVGGCATAELIAAVGTGGGLGLLPATWLTPEQAVAEVAAIRTASDRPFGVNLVLRFPIDDLLDALLDVRTPVITFSWGVPGRDRVRRCHDVGAIVAVQVGTPTPAPDLIADGVDLLIVQGVEAGGHVQSTTTLASLLPTVLAVAGSTPVIAAGGLAAADDVARVIAAGASGAMLGTRFVATRESNAHPRYKDLLVRADAADAVTTLCFDGEWPHGPHRVLRNGTIDRWEAAGCPWPGERPGEDDVILRHADGSNALRYSDDPPRAGDDGAIDEACLYAGTGVGRIDDLPSAAALVERLA